MKLNKYKMAKGYNRAKGRYYAIYKRMFLFFWVYESFADTKEKANDIIDWLNEK